MRVVCLWSGGKDSCFACYKAKLQGHKIISLFNFAGFDGKNSLSHNLPSRIIFEQTAMTRISFFQKAMPKETYTEEFKKLMLIWKRERDIKGIVFGDIYLMEHKDWIDKVCDELQVKPVMPLWGIDTKRLIKEFIQIGFKAVVVSTRADFLGKEWLGREIDNDFIKELEAMGGVDFCGEKGEFHTFVYDGPIFKKPVKFIHGEKILKDKHWFLELKSKER